jgi:hypothetical protein
MEIVRLSDFFGIVFNLGMKDSAKKYQAGDLKSLGDHKFSTSFTISNADAEEVNKDHYLVVKGSDAKKSENKYENSHAFWLLSNLNKIKIIYFNTCLKPVLQPLSSR